MNSLSESLEQIFRKRKERDIIRCQEGIKNRSEIKNINKITNICYNSIYSIMKRS